MKTLFSEETEKGEIFRLYTLVLMPESPEETQILEKLNKLPSISKLALTPPPEVSKSMITLHFIGFSR